MSAVFRPTSFHDEDTPAPAQPSWLASAQRRLEPLLAWPVSALLGAVFQTPEAWCMGRIDPGTGLYNRAGFLAYGGAMQERARREHKPLAVAVFDFEDLLEVRGIYGDDVYVRVMDHLVRKLRVLAGPRGLCARTGRGQFTVVLPGLAQARALRAVQRVLGRPTRIELDVGDEELVLVPDFRTVDAAGAAPVGELHLEVCRVLLEDRQHEERRRHYLQRERERHSRPQQLLPRDWPRTPAAAR